MLKVMEMEPKPIPRATSSLPDSIVNSDAFDDILDRAFAIVENRQQGFHVPDRVTAEQLNVGVEDYQNQPTSIEQQIQQLTLAVHPTDQMHYSQQAPVFHSIPPVDHPVSTSNAVEIEHQAIYQGMSQQPQMPWPYVLPQGWTVHPNSPIPDFQPQQNMAAPGMEEKSQLSAFICYLYEKGSSDVMSDVLAIEATLKSAGISPRVDYREEDLRGLNKNGWLQDCMDNSSVIIICVNPSFKSILRSYRSQSDENDANAETYFLMDMLITKYRGEGCKNYNVLPLLIAGARFMDLPTWLQNTNVYRWPKDCEKLIQRILALQD